MSWSNDSVHCHTTDSTICFAFCSCGIDQYAVVDKQQCNQSNTRQDIKCRAPLHQVSSSRPGVSTLIIACRRKEKATPFGVRLTRSLVTHTPDCPHHSMLHCSAGPSSQRLFNEKPGNIPDSPHHSMLHSSAGPSNMGLRWRRQQPSCRPGKSRPHKVCAFW